MLRVVLLNGLPYPERHCFAPIVMTADATLDGLSASMGI
jgi:hypothetical protein